MTTDLLDFPTIEAAPMPATPPVPAPVAAPAQTTVATVTPSIKDTVLAQFKDAEVSILALAEKYRAVAFDVSTTKGMNEAKAARLELREKGRFAVQRAEKAVKADVNDLKRVMADEVDRLVAIVQPVEDAIDAQIKAEEERKAREKAERERIEAERIAGHQERMAKIGAYLTHCQQYGMTAARIQVGIERLAAATFGPEWQEFAVPAANLQCETLEAMRKLHAQAVEREAEALRLEQQREEQERMALAQAEAQRQLDEAAEALRVQQEAVARQAAELEAARAALAAPAPTPAAEPAPGPAVQAALAEVLAVSATIGNPPFQGTAQPGVQTPAAQGEVAGSLAQPQPGAPFTLGDAAADDVAGVGAVLPAPTPVASVVAPVREPTDLERCRMALADACDLLEGWIVSKCPKKHTAEHFAHVARLRDMGGLPRNTPTTN